MMNDEMVLNELMALRREGHDNAKVSTIARRVRSNYGVRTNAVKVLGAAMRVLPKYRRWVNQKSKG